MKCMVFPKDIENIFGLKTGERILVDGLLYTARDAAHKKLVGMVKKNKKLPIDLSVSAVYYCGPTPWSSDDSLISAGPTTSSRMDNFLEPLMKAGLKVTIGKGERSSESVDVIKKYGGIYFSTYGGCGAYLGMRIVKRKLVAFRELGPEAIYLFEVKDFPLIVAVDSMGNSLFDR